MSNTETFVLDTDRGARLHGIVNLPETTRPGPHPTVVVCHGFKGFMEWGFFPPLADLLAARGFTVVRFNLSGTGMDPGDELVTRPEEFRRATFSKDLDELRQVLAAAGAGRIAGDHVDRDRLAVVGHSRGGGLAVLAAALPEWRERLRALVTWAAVSTFFRVDDTTCEHWRKTGALPVANARTGQRLEMGIEVLEDLERHRDELDPCRAAGERRAPWLIVHGEDDETVPAAEARTLAERAAGTSELEIVPGGSHTFGAVHPFAAPTPQVTRAMNATQVWLRRHLG